MQLNRRILEKNPDIHERSNEYSHNPDTAPQNRTTSLNPFGTPPAFVSSAILQTENIFQ